MTYHTLNRIRKVPVFVVRVLIYPVKLLFFPLWFLIGFFNTDWENAEDRAFFHKTNRDLIRF